jgi:hypothetical protein
MAERFQVGERVRARSSTWYIRAGMIGTIRSVFLPTKKVYLVQFDELPKPEIASEAQLEQVDGPPDQAIE